MNMMLASFIGGWEMVLILAVVLVLFGSKKLPELAKGLGQGIKEFKKATREVSEEISSSVHDNSPAPATLKLPSATVPMDQSHTPANDPNPAQKA